jgi:hypothetical protein
MRDSQRLTSIIDPSPRTDYDTAQVGGSSLAISQIPDPPRSGIEILTETASDHRLPLNFRFDALGNMPLIAAQGKITEDESTRILESRTPIVPSFFGNVSPDLVRCAMSALKAALPGGQSEASQLAVYLRHADARVRSIATSALGRMLTDGDVFLYSMLTSAMFDPDEDVVLQALRAIREHPQLEESTGPVILMRLTSLYFSSSRNIRGGVILTARAISRLESRSSLRDLLLVAAADRSWQVRRTLSTDVAQLDLPENPAES